MNAEEALTLIREFGGWAFAALFYMDFRKLLIDLKEKIEELCAKSS